MRRSFVSLRHQVQVQVTPFAVITDSETNVKYPLADFALTPDVAIIDPGGRECAKKRYSRYRKWMY